MIAWFDAKKIDLMWWPAQSPDLNPVENLWSIIVRQVYVNNKKYDSIVPLRYLSVRKIWKLKFCKI